MHREQATLDDWLDRIERAHPAEIELGLERTSRVAARMGTAISAATVITVAGTNGKGSCVAVMERVLLAAGKRVGAYTSPHLRHYNERVRVQGRAVDDAALCAAFAAVEHAREETPLTYFEFGTLAALEIFRHARLDFLLLEVGLGGRLDAVNIIDADVAVISSIQIDHTDWLGKDRETIAGEKAGIFRSRTPVVCADRDPPQALYRAADALEAPWFGIGAQFDTWRNTSGEWCWRGTDRAGQALEHEGLAPPQLLDGNVAAALQALLLCDIALDRTMLASVLPSLTLAGRFQQRRLREIECVLDVAHNLAATEVLAARLAGQAHAGRTAVVFAAMGDKDIDAMLAVLSGCASAWFLPQLHATRAAPAPDVARRLEALAGKVSVQCCADVGVAMHHALATLRRGDRLLVCGSFHTVGPALEWLDQQDGINGDRF